MVVLSILFGIALFSYTRYLAGSLAAVLAVIMFSLEPTILAHGRIVQTDVPAAFAYLLFFFTLQRLVDGPSVRRSFGFGLAAGFALVIKFSLVIILPVFAVALVVLGWRQYKADPRISNMAVKLGAAVVASLLVVNLAYYFKRTPLSPANRESVVQEWPEHVTAAARTFHVASAIIPSTYLFGIFVITVHNHWGHYASLLGEHSRTGWWYYFPVAFALKTTVPFLLVSISALFWAVWRLIRHRETNLFLPLLAIVVYATFSMNSRINIGVRHFLPVFSFLFLLSGILLSRLLQTTHYKQAATGIVVLLCSWMALETVRTFPNYIPYMNQLAYSRPHWYYLSDSNVEWGDDTGELAQYLLERGETRVRAALLGGWMSKVQYGVDYVNPLVVNQPVEQTRYIAIGASFLNGSTVPLIRDQAGRPITEQQRRDFFAAYRSRTPEAIFGNSIYLFRERE
jgi:4-amino-4-deoxy-L-arabinose transferase-like glycosyltransferase